MLLLLFLGAHTHLLTHSHTLSFTPFHTHVHIPPHTLRYTVWNPHKPQRWDKKILQKNRQNGKGRVLAETVGVPAAGAGQQKKDAIKAGGGGGGESSESMQARLVGEEMRRSQAQYSKSQQEQQALQSTQKSIPLHYTLHYEEEQSPCTGTPGERWTRIMDLIQEQRER